VDVLVYVHSFFFLFLFLNFQMYGCISSVVTSSFLQGMSALLMG
jgi:hypothetical protein